MFQRTTCAIVLLTGVGLLASFAQTSGPCSYGCVGHADPAASDTDSSCPGASITISVLVQSSNCSAIVGYPQPFLGCNRDEGCVATIVRSWDGLPTGSSMNFCVQIAPGQPWRCIYPPPIVDDDGAGSDSKQYTISCSGVSWAWNFSAMCGLSATVTGSCSFCPIYNPHDGD